jgi:hypothetical protein
MNSVPHGGPKKFKVGMVSFRGGRLMFLREGLRGDRASGKLGRKNEAGRLFSSRVVTPPGGRPRADRHIETEG